MKSLEITTRSTCPIRCGFCPQGNLAKAYGGQAKELSLAGFALALTTLPKDVRVDMSGFVEPFFNPNAPQMALFAKQAGHELAIYTTLMGLNAEGAKILELAKPNLIRIHVPDRQAMVLPDEKWIRQFEIFAATGLDFTMMAMGPLTDRVSAFLGQFRMPVEMPTMLSRAGNLWQRPKYGGRVLCAMERWHSNVLLPNGDVYLCCHDYSLTTRLGNLFIQPYQEIYDEAERLRNAERAPEICTSCEWGRSA